MAKDQNNTVDQQEMQYKSGITRRDSLKLMMALAASALLPAALTGCDSAPVSKTDVGAGVAKASTEHWPDLKLSPITATGYGKDPNLILPPESPWPLTLTQAQLSLVAVLSDILVPREGSVPSASEVHVPAVVDEWVSAPYERQQEDRVTILSALAWIDDEAQMRFDNTFVALDKTQRKAIMDDIAYDIAETPAQFKRIATAFGRFRALVLAAFFCTPEGTKDIGYLGNVPIGGDYPGPTKEAYEHLDKVLADLGLTEYAYPIQA
ncbi:gluconate 2-dehydrogenase subunit 3 family protein [Rheinheimera soli]|uniref:gluconate 2-dehydrogenase subunit 3 family protein n=1 Tax=Rheinheimera soli TaxID=443616 RepID=UPI001E4D791E|nr:gluconate 2-dehydrogenase subunit 3 family protein [Rheinheimera soli]